MRTYLDNLPGHDTNRVKYEILDVAYYDDPKYYICQFKVRMKVPAQRLDTVGMMSGTVSHDFQEVHRKY
jgi:hypothetical protein